MNGNTVPSVSDWAWACDPHACTALVILTVLKRESPGDA
jgi:hypothetical protein